MALFDIFKPKQSLDCSFLPAPIKDYLKDNYYNKYKNESIETSVYLLYCDFSSCNRWIKDTSDINKYFENYKNALLILNELKKYSPKYNFQHPTPEEQFKELSDNYSHNTDMFIQRYWKSTIKLIDKLKTDKGKNNKKQCFIDSLMIDHINYLTEGNISLIKSIERDNYNTLSDSNKSLNFISCGKYQINSISEIQSIPYTDSSVLRLLQKAATDHKRNENYVLAIECLRKSNQISDNITDQYNKLTEKEYLRLLSFIKKYMPEKSHEEEQIIRNIHPEFWDKSIISKKNILKAIDTAKEMNVNTIFITSTSFCPNCKMYNNKVFSINGKNKKFKPLPEELINFGGACSEHIIGANVFFEDID